MTLTLKLTEKNQKLESNKKTHWKLWKNVKSKLSRPLAIK